MTTYDVANALLLLDEVIAHADEINSGRVALGIKGGIFFERELEYVQAKAIGLWQIEPS